jgi:hypothetical protein
MSKAVAPATDSRPARKRRGIDELRAKYDRSYQIPRAIAEVFDTYIKGDGWLYDAEMLDEVCARVPKARSRWSQYRDMEQYQQMQVRVDDKIVWVDPKNREAVERMRAT